MVAATFRLRKERKAITSIRRRGYQLQKEKITFDITNIYKRRKNKEG